MKKYNIISGIDVGVTGALAYVQGGKIQSSKMKRETNDIFNDLQYINSLGNVLFFIEKVNLRPSDLKDGRVYRLQKMLSNYSEIKAMLKILKADYVEVTPRVWQKEIGLPKIDDYASRKRALKKIAERLTKTKTTIQLSDSILITIFGIKKFKNDSDWIYNRLLCMDNNYTI